MMAIYQCQLCFQAEDDPKESERDAIFTYYAPNDIEAVDDAVRIWLNRTTSLPGHFTTLGCVKVWRYHVQEVTDEGYCPTVGGHTFFEWKAGVTLLPMAVAAFKQKREQDAVDKNGRPEPYSG